MKYDCNRSCFAAARRHPDAVARRAAHHGPCDGRQHGPAVRLLVGENGAGAERRHARGHRHALLCQHAVRLRDDGRLDAGGHCEDAHPEHEAGSGERPTAVQRIDRCAAEGVATGRRAGAVEGLHAVLLPAGAAHGHHVHAAGAAERAVPHQGAVGGQIEALWAAISRIYFLREGLFLFFF